MKDYRIVISLLVVLMLVFCVNAVCAEDSDNNTLTADNTVDIISEENTTVYVDGSFGGDEQGSMDSPFSKISSAVDNGGETIIIKEGNYTESINLPAGKNMSFTGENKENVVINLKKTIKYTLNGNNLVFNNLTFVNDGASMALNIMGNGNLSIINCNFIGFGSPGGTLVISNTQSTILDCELINQTGRGFIRYEGKGEHILKNMVVDNDTLSGSSINDDYCGLLLVGSNSNVYADNLNITNTKLSSVNRIDNMITVGGGNLIINNSNIIGNRLNFPIFSVSNGNLTIEYTNIADNSGLNYFMYTYSNAHINMNYNIIAENSRQYNFYWPSGPANSYSLNVDYNWWGSNNKPDNGAKYWVVMSADSSKRGDNVTFVADFNKYTDGVNYYNLDNPVVDGLLVHFNSSCGTLDEDVAVKDGVASVCFAPVDDEIMVEVSVNKERQVLFSNVVYVDGSFDGAELGTWDNPYKSISSAVLNSKSWETIFVKDGFYDESVIELDYSLNIIGESQNGVVISSSNGFFRLNKSGINVSLCNLTFNDLGSNLKSIDISSAADVSIVDCYGKLSSIYINASSIYLDNCYFVDGSAIYLNSSSGEVFVKNSVIRNFTSDDSIIVCDGVLYLDNVLMIGNNAKSALVNANLLNLSYCVVENNNAEHIFNSSDINVIYSAIFNNTFTNFICVGGNVSADFNWWGNNTKPDYIDVNNWVIMDVECAIHQGYVVINTYFDKCFDGNNVSFLNHGFADVPFGIKTNNYEDIVYSKQFKFINSYNDPLVNISCGFINYIFNIFTKTIYVDGGYDGDEELGTRDKPYKTISMALSKINSGDKIYIKNGEYTELSIDLPNNKDVMFIGESRNGVSLNLRSMMSATLNNTSISFVNLDIYGSDSSVLSVDGVGDLNIINCTFDGFKSSSTMFDICVNSIIENTTFKNLLLSATNTNVLSYGNNTFNKIKNSLFNSIISQ